MGKTWPALEVSLGARVDRSEMLQAALADYDVTAIVEEAHTWRVFFHTSVERDRALDALRTAFSDFAFAPIDVPDENWAERSQSALRAIRVGAVVVAPPWDVPELRSSGTPELGNSGTPELAIVIKPSTGFGTGHHATTRLCLGALQRIELRDRTALDVGTGSGVLAIAASLLGAGPVAAFDDDEDAIAAARENLELNPRARVSLDVGDLRATPRSPADVVVANLTGGLLLATVEDLRHLTKPGGRLILSGFVTAEERDIVAAFAPLVVEHRDEEEEWVCVTLR